MTPLRFGGAGADRAALNVLAFLKLIRWAEGTLDAGMDGYRMHFGGELCDAALACHPRKRIEKKSRGRTIVSTACGAYQFRWATWQECAAALRLPDFSPASQDRAAVYLIRRRGALEHVRAGRVAMALELCANEWASFPSSKYGQPTVQLHEALERFVSFGGTLDTHQEQQRGAA